MRATVGFPRNERLRLIVLAGALLSSTMGGVAAWADDDDDDEVRPTRGFYAFPTGASWESVNIGTSFTVIQTLSLPPGRYIANATAVLASSDVELHFVDCVFTLDGVFFTDPTRGLLGGSLNNFITLPLTTGFRITATQELGVACVSEVADVVVSQPSPITAISLDRLIIRKGFPPTTAAAQLSD